jgi:hypothetical protein
MGMSYHKTNLNSKIQKRQHPATAKKILEPRLNLYD